MVEAEIIRLPFTPCGVVDDDVSSNSNNIKVSECYLASASLRPYGCYIGRCGSLAVPLSCVHMLIPGLMLETSHPDTCPSCAVNDQRDNGRESRG